jgi:glycosyltransferase involved in cell wall biosynthesis
MRIVLIGPAHPLRGGLASFNERMAVELQADGHEVVVFSFKFQYPGFLFPGKTQFTDAAAPVGIDIRPVIHSLLPYNWLRTARAISRLKPDMVVCRFWLPFMAPCLGSILRLVAYFSPKTERIALIDNIVPHEKRPGDRLLAGYFAGSVNRFVAMAEKVGEDLASFVKPNQRISITPHPIFDNYGDKVDRDEARKHIGLPKTGRWVLFFGFIRRYKGLDLLLEALADPRVKAAGISAVIAGEYYDKAPYYEPFFAAIDPERLLLKTDFIAESEVKYYFSAVDGVVQPYRSATQSGITQIAYHFGLPMVVTHVGGLPEMVPHQVAGLVVPPDAISVADALLEFYAGDGPTRFAQGVEDQRVRFSWPTFVRVLKS